MPFGVVSRGTLPPSLSQSTFCPIVGYSLSVDPGEFFGVRFGGILAALFGLRHADVSGAIVLLLLPDKFCKFCIHDYNSTMC
jgi:hypothetical protein